MRDDWLEPEEAADILGVHPSTVARWSDTGRLWRTFTPGGHRRYDRAEVVALKRELEAEK